MTVLLTEHIRRAAHDKHRCRLCHELIARGEGYLDQRCVNDGSAYTFRCHTDCNTRYWRAYRAAGWFDDDEFMEWSEVLAWEGTQT